MQKLVECVPNFSEGRRVTVIEEISSAMERAGALVLDRTMDADHNRAVITFVAEPKAAAAAAFNAIQAAARLISLETHRGEHPRIGATDVVPFIPLRGVTMDECIGLAQQLGARVGTELAIPVYLYALAARRTDRRALADLRRGEYEGLKKEIATNPDRAPDFGPKKIGPAGATTIGARDFLIAFNINLATSDLKIAREIARVIRESSGGMKGLQAKGFFLHSRNLAQVSMNLTDFRTTGLLAVFERVKAEADQRGVQILESELIGLTPVAALAQVAQDALKLPLLDATRVVESQTLAALGKI